VEPSGGGCQKNQAQLGFLKQGSPPEKGRTGRVQAKAHSSKGSAFLPKGGPTKESGDVSRGRNKETTEGGGKPETRGLGDEPPKDASRTNRREIPTGKARAVFAKLPSRWGTHVLSWKKKKEKQSQSSSLR